MDPLRHLRPAQRFALARALRHRPTPAERHAWTLLRNRGILGLKFRRQHVLQGFIVDFCCASERVVIELEGSPHDEAAQQTYDRARAELLAAAGYRIVRVRNKDVSREHFETVLTEVLGPRP
jgi:very-short-patch-repair endonuclease